MKECDCERGSVAFYATVTTAEGVVLDRVGYCAECMATLVPNFQFLGLSVGGGK